MDPKLVTQVCTALIKAGFRECRIIRKGRGKPRYASGYRGVRGYSDFKFYITHDLPISLQGMDFPDGTSFLGVSCENPTVANHKSYAKALNEAGIPTVTCGTNVYKSVRVWIAIPQIYESDEV